MKKILIGVGIALFAMHGVAQFQTGTLKSWGPVRGVFIDPRTHNLKLVFEDTAGTIRIAIVDEAEGTTKIATQIDRK